MTGNGGLGVMRLKNGLSAYKVWCLTTCKPPLPRLIRTNEPPSSTDERPVSNESNSRDILYGEIDLKLPLLAFILHSRWPYACYRGD